jgi:CRP/FNR family cyclic AMP-dependent transcriptional regulator
MTIPVPNPQARKSPEDYDPLLYLPCSSIVHHSRGEMIYSAANACSHLYVVIAGCVQVSRFTAEGRQIVVDIYVTDEFFGENALVTAGQRCEEAIAVEDTMVMSWTVDDVEQLIHRRPALGIALVKLMARRGRDLAERLENLSLNCAPLRLAKALIRFSQRLGTLGDDGRVIMRGFTQEFLAQYIGSSREVVNVSLASLRGQQIVEYSRSETRIRIGALSDWIRNNQ